MNKLIILCFSVLLGTAPAFSQLQSPQNTTTLANAKSGNSDIFSYVEQMPQAPFNVSEYLSKAIVYPSDAQDKNIEGTVMVRFIIWASGKIDSPVVTKSVYPSIDSTAVSVIQKMPDWKPGMSNDKPVNVYFNLPVKFALANKSKNKRKN